MCKLMHAQQGSKTFTHRDAIILRTSNEKLRREALAKDVDLATLTKTALGYEQLRKSCRAMKSTSEDIHRVDIRSTYTKEQVHQIVALVIAGKYSSRIKDKYRGDPLSWRETKKWSKQIEFSAESNQFERKIKSGNKWNVQ